MDVLIIDPFNAVIITIVGVLVYEFLYMTLSPLQFIRDQHQQEGKTASKELA